MLTESLNIYVINKDGNKVTFPNVEGMQPAIVDVNLNRERMAGVPTNTSTLMYPICLDSYWTKKEFIEIGSERYYVKQVPTSEKNTEDARYKHEITFVSERDILENVFFFDCVTQDTSSQISDKPRTNTTEFSFYGDLNELVQRLNDSLSYSKIYDPKGENGFCIVIDDDVEIGEAKEVSMTDAYFATAMQEIYNVFEVPYYWVGKICHVGYQENEITEPFEYGSGNGLISVQKTNAEFRLINRITGQGSADNIPYYYPNADVNGIAEFETYNIKNPNNVKVLTSVLTSRIGSDFLRKDIVLSKNPSSKDFSVSADEAGGYNNGISIISGGTGGTIYSASYIVNIICYLPKGVIVDLSTLSGSAYSTKEEYAKILDSGSEVKKYCRYYESYEQISNYAYEAVPINKEIDMEGIWQFQLWIPWKIQSAIKTTEGWIYAPTYLGIKKEGAFVIKYKNGELYSLSIGDKIIPYSNSGIVIPNIEQQPCDKSDITFKPDSKGVYRLGIEVVDKTDNPSKIVINNVKRVPIMSKLMPSVYRQTEGAERFYNAKNETYLDENGNYYSFNNPYVPSEPLEGKQDFEDIKPTINGITNENGELFGEIAAVAFDDTDSDDLSVEDASDANTNTAKPVHPYFYVKLHKFSGENGFNLFKQGLAQGAMTFNFITGSCAGCSFKVQVSEGKQVDNHYEFKNLVQVDEQGNIVAGDSGDKIKDGKEIASQQDTMTNSVWVALEKDNSTFGVLMPNATNNYRPQGKTALKEGDKFVITNILLPTQYITAAEKRLDAALVKYMSENNDEKFTFSIKFSRIYLQKHPEIAEKINENTKLHVKYNNVDYPLFVSSYSRKSDDNILDEISVELSEKLTIAQNKSKEQMDSIMGNVNEQINSAIQDNNNNTSQGISAAEINSLKTLLGNKLSRVSDDTAAGIITFLQGLVSNGAITAKDGATFGEYMNGLIGKGGSIDKDGHAEFESIFARAFISAAEFRFNRISVIEGEMWLTCGYGTIEEVDTEAKTITLHLEEDDYAAIAQGDICRGQYNDIGGERGSSNKDKDTDECGFAVKRYHFTSYFKVMKILEYEKGKCVFEYELKDTSTPHPCRFMKFAQYGNEIDKSRQASAYISTVNHFYFQSMEKVNTWVIDTRMVTIRFGWLDNFPYKKKSGETAYLNGYGMYVPSNIYLGNAILNLDAASLDELTKQLGQYVIEFGTYADVLTVDDAGNVVGGLYKMNDSGEKYDYRVNSAIFVKRGNDYLTISNGSGSASLGEYKLTAYAENCECFIDSSTLYISSVKNIKDGVAGSGDDTNFNYDAMRAMSNFKVTIVADCEGIGTISREFVVTLKHDSQPYIRMDLDREFSAVSWNTKNGAYVGLPLTITLSAWRNDCAVEIYSNNGVPGISVAGLPAGAEYTKTINSDGKGVIAITSLPEAMNTVTPLSITASVSYAGILYERTLKHTINRFGDTNIYTLETEPTAVTVRHDTAGEPVFSAQTVACKVVCRNSDDDAYEVSPDDYEKLGISITYLTFDTDGNPGAEGEKPYTNPVPVSADLGSVRFTMTENDVVTYADVPLVLDGIDGKGIEYVYMRNNDEKTAPTLIDKSATDEFQSDDYCPPASEGGEGEATTRWTDNPVGVSQEYRFEWVAKRTKTNGRWNKFSDPKLWGRYAVDGISPYSLELTNQASLVASDEDGNVDEANVTYETTTFMVYKGSTPVLTDGYTYTVTATNISAEISESEDRMRVTITPSGITSDHAEIAVTVVPKDATDVRLANVYTLAKTRQGVTAVIYSLVVSPDVIRKNNDGTLKDTTMNVRVKKTAGKNSVLLTELPDELSVKYSNGSGIATLGKLSDIAVSELIGDSNQVEFYLYKGEDVIDREPVGVISDGKGIKNVSNKWNVSASMDVAPTEWFDASPELTMDTPYLWMQTTTEYTYGDPSVTTTVAGKMGDKGIDGDKTEYIFCLTKTEEAPELPESNDPITSNGEKGKWSDDPLGVDEDTWRYEWASKHTWSEGTWGAYSKPKIWARYGVKFVTGNISGGVSKTFEEWQAICGSMTGSRWYCENVAEIAVSDILVIEGTISDKRGLGITLYSRVIAIEVDEADSSKGWVTALALSYTVDGEDAPTIKVVHNYYKAGISPDTPPLEDEQNVWVEITDGTDFSAAGFSPTSPYLWNYEIIEFSFGSPSEPSEKRMIGYWSKGVDKIMDQLMASNDNTKHPAEDDEKWQDISAGSPQLSSTSKYLWNRQKIVYNDGTDSGWTYACIGAYGDTGDAGRSVTGVINYYQANNSDTEAPSVATDEDKRKWSTDPKNAGFSREKPYLWNYEEVTYDEGDPTLTLPSLVGTWGVGVKAILELYGLSKSGEAKDDGDIEWQAEVGVCPQMDSLWRYLYNKEKIVYDGEDEGSVAFSSPKLIGVYGDKGASVTSAKDYYQATASNSSDELSDDGWKDTVGETAWSASYPYLWNKEVVSLSDNTSYTIEPHYIGTWAVGIAGVKELWAVTKTNDAKTIGNKDESITPGENVVPAMDANYRYLWNKQCIIYDNGTDGAWSEWKLIGTYGMSVKEIAMQYAVSGSPSIKPAESDWSDATQELNSANRCLWIRTKPVYDNDMVNSSVDWGTPQPIGTYGQEAVQYYLVSNDDTIPVDENGISEHGTSTGAVTLMKAVGDNLPVATTDLSIDYYIVDYNGVETAASAANTSPVTYTYSDIDYNAKLRFKAYYTDVNRQKVIVCQLDIDARRKGDTGYGEDAMVYSIDVNPDELHVDGLGNVSLPSTITATVKVTEGRGTPYKLYGALIYVRRYANGELQKFEGLDYKSSPTFTISDLSTYEDAIKESDYILFTASYQGVNVAKKTIPIIKAGKGFVVVSRGVFNANGYLLGKDDSGTEVYSGGYYYKFDGGVYVRDMVLYDGYYYMVSNLTDAAITEAPSPTSDVWTLASMYNLLIANAIYTEGATLGGFYINDKKLWSKTDNPEDPDCPLLLDGEKGKLKSKDADIEGKIVANEGEFNNCTINDTCEVKGRLNGVTGTFTSLSALDDAGNTGTTLSFGDQRLTIDGHLNQQGTVDGNSLRFYSAHIWCRGSFGAYQLNTVVVEQMKAKYYYDGLEKNKYYEKELTPETINGKSCYSLPLYSPSTDDTAAGFPVDMVLFKSGDKSMYYIFTEVVPGKMVHCINLEDDNNNTYILGNSGYTQCAGGVAQTWFYAGKDNVNPTNNNSGAGWLIMTQYDNNW